ncbi:M3 family metallopeptidase [Streptomyces sp. WM6368]|uniref:M3 family metallopeptidase n=1 Tax=Streptomyces sp. WM6368 TaxID=1415554 RepID=UPI0006B023BF|nr:M3 family metallopeptidase [Streptomyces sp. WM6368]KOU22204.1 hypothetical protein ADK51_20615 [Streptomyces sp. WM6368]
MTVQSGNPLLVASREPYGIPPFKQVTTDHYVEAFDEAVRRQAAAVGEIVADPRHADFHNTVEPLETSGQLLAYVSDAFFHQLMAGGAPGLVAIERQVVTTLSRHEKKITGNRELALRVGAVDASGVAGDEGRRLVESWQLRFRRSGATLEPEAFAELAKTNAELARLTTEYRRHLVEDGDARALVVCEAGQLAGLPADQVAQAAGEAERRGMAGHVLHLAGPSSQPALTRLADPGIRRQLHEASLARAPQNADRAARMSHLRAGRADLLGYPTHAAYVTEEQTAGTPTAVEEMFARLAPAVVSAAVAERGSLPGSTDPHASPVEPWDWAYRSERAKAESGLDDVSLRPYLELESVLWRGLFHTAQELYGLSFLERTDVTGHHPDTRTFEVLDADGSPRGLFSVDFWARAGKRGGAWMSCLTHQARLTGARPVVVCTFNLGRPAAGDPCLLTPGEVTQIFHEFGHALHALLSDVTYPSFAAPGVPRDFAEAPAQVHEAWAWHPAVLPQYARHHRTGEPLPAEWTERLTGRGHGEGSGFALAEILGAACLDWAWHTRTVAEGPATAADVERAAAHAYGLDAVPEIPPRYRSGYFDHVFVGPYGALFYSYLWSEIIAANLWEWFQSQGGLNRQAGDRFRTLLLGRGGAVDAMSAFRELTGVDPQTEPFLRRRGLGTYDNVKDGN